MERGLIRVRALDGTYPFESFQIETTSDIFATLKETIDSATPTAVDLSASSVKVYLRAKVKGTALLPTNLEMTKRTGTTTPGDTGKVSVAFRPGASDYAADDFCVMGVYVIDQATADTPTPSGYKETLWGELWEWKAIGKIDGSGV